MSEYPRALFDSFESRVIYRKHGEKARRVSHGIAGCSRHVASLLPRDFCIGSALGHIVVTNLQGPI
jgi:hypothetical protein